MDNIINMIKRRMYFIIGGVVIIILVILWLTIGGGVSGATPGKKVMADTNTKLMGTQRQLDVKRDKIHPCHDVNGNILLKQGACEEGTGDPPRRHDDEWPDTTIEVDDTSGGDPGGGCNDSC